MLAEVIDKALRDQAYVIVLVPYWTKQDWFRKAYGVAVKTYFYKAGTKMFESAGGDMPGTKWPTMAMLLDGSPPHPVRWPLEDNPTFGRTTSSSRRYRRKYKESVLC